MNAKRIRVLKDVPAKIGPVAYWMSRDQRVNDNWALLLAQELALKNKEPLAVIFCLVPHFLGATIRQYGFMLKGLEQVEQSLNKKNLPFYLLTGGPQKQIPAFVKKLGISTLVTDFDPLRPKRHWKKQISSRINIPFYEVDTHNIVPCWLASDKQEYGAYTIRPKLKRLLPEFLQEFSKVKKHPFSLKSKIPRIDWSRALRALKVDTAVPELDWIRPGEKAAHKMLTDFLQHKLESYSRRRNDPNQDGQSNLSPYLHFGQLAPQRVALEVQKSNASKNAKEAFLEELIIRRELSDNFCRCNPHYDSVKCFPDWAAKTLTEHRKDPREYTYPLDTLEHGKTHDNLWNAAQMQMVKRGKMHGYMRMYWSKKILEWTNTADEAMEIAITLNDKYELDGRDPNGYAGIAWSIGGVHDRPWKSRKVFGKIRYMSYNGCKSKFNVEKYISTYL